MEKQSNNQEQTTASAAETDERQIFTKATVGVGRKKWFWYSAIALVVAINILFWWWLGTSSSTDDVAEPNMSTISSYEECVEAGYPIMESYPEQCAVPGGDSFTRQLSEEEQAILDSNL